MDRKWTFFLSSTYEDLRVERQTIVNQILKMEEIPIGMEQFGAIDKSSWENIEKFIDTADYYILLIAGRYGSYKDSPEGISYTEREYRYAKSKNIPVIAVLHGDPGSLPGKMTEGTEEGRAKLDAFRAEVQGARLVAFYTNTTELIGEVAAAIGKAKQRFPRPGWVRDQNDTNALQRELDATRAQLSDAVEKIDLLTSTRLRSESDDGSPRGSGAPVARRKLSSTTTIMLRFIADGKIQQTSKDLRWSELFVVIASNLVAQERYRIDPLKQNPKLFDLASAELAVMVEKMVGKKITNLQPHPDLEEDMEYVFESLELITKHRIVGFTLTPLGRKVYVDYRAGEVFNKNYRIVQGARARQAQSTTRRSTSDD